MDVLRVLHFADCHLGVEAGGRPNPATGLNQRVHDVCDRLDEICACVEDEGVQLVVFAGDAFRNQHPTPTLQKLFATRIRRLARAGARVFLLVGNHDLPKMAALAHPFSIYDALEVEGVVVGERAQVYTLPLDGPAPAVQVAALPHFSRASLQAKLADQDADLQAVVDQAVAGTVRRLACAADPALPALFAGHCHVNQAELTTAQHLFGVSELEVSLGTLTTPPAFAYYALGHVHRRQVLRRDPFVAYSGSLERVDFSEGQTVVVGERVRCEGGEEKGFYRFDLRREGERWVLADEPSFRRVAARPFVTVKVGALPSEDPTAALRAALRRVREAGVRLEGAFVRLQAALDPTDRHRVSERAVREELREAYDVRLRIEATEAPAAVRDPRFARRMPAAEALERYLETRPDWAADREALLAAGRALIAEEAEA